jgi:putative MATE family efflux protein
LNQPFPEPLPTLTQQLTYGILLRDARKGVRVSAAADMPAQHHIIVKGVDGVQSKQITNFTEGSIPRHLIAFSAPMFLGNLLQAFYNTVDSIWVGRFLGANALAAVSVGFPVIFAMVALVMGIAMASTILVAQYFGAGQHERVMKTVNNSLLMLTVLGGVVSVLGFAFRTPLLRLINTPAEIIDQASSYLGIYLSGLIVMFLYNTAGAILRGLGDSRTPLRFLIYATVINVFLDPLLIFGLGPIPAMGVSGAALATVIAQGISAILALHYLYARSGIVTYQPGTFRPDWGITRLTFRIGLPAGLQQVLVSLSALVVNSIVNSFGATVVAAFGSAARLDQFAFMPAMSVGAAASALVGQNLGADRDDRVRETVKWALMLAASITALVSLVAIFSPNLLLSMFTKDVGVLAEGARYLRYMSLAYIPLALMFTLGGVLRGTGDTMATMVLSLLSLWGVRVPLARHLVQQGYGISGVWTAIAISAFSGFLLHLTYYRSGRWRSKAVTRGPKKAFGES